MVALSSTEEADVVTGRKGDNVARPIICGVGGSPDSGRALDVEASSVPLRLPRQAVRELS
jgi:hypothetical protein